MIMAILELRVRMRDLYQKLQLLIDPVVKFAIAFFVIRALNNAIGYDERFTKMVVVLLLSLLCTFTPPSVLVLLCVLLSLVHTLSVHFILAFFLLLFYMIIYFLFLRFTPKENYLAVMVPVLYVLKIPYLAPLLMGVRTTPLSILPMSCGVLVYHMFGIIRGAAALQVSATITDLSLETLLDDMVMLQTYVVDSLMEQKDMLLTILVFAVVTITVFCIRKIAFPYSFESSILAGAVVCVFGFLISGVIPDGQGSFGAVVLFVLVSALITLVIQFFKRVLDYTAIDHVQFEDDDYYYYVKAVPKISVSIPQMNIKKISELHLFEDNRYHRDADFEEDDTLFHTKELDRRLMEQRLHMSQQGRGKQKEQLSHDKQKEQSSHGKPREQQPSLPEASSAPEGETKEEA